MKTYVIAASVALAALSAAGCIGKGKGKAPPPAPVVAPAPLVTKG